MKKGKSPLKLNINPVQRERISLALKVALFAFVIAWDVLFLTAAVILWFKFLDVCPAGALGGLLATWYLITVVIIGAWVANKGAQQIGRWEYPKSQKPQLKK